MVDDIELETMEGKKEKKGTEREMKNQKREGLQVEREGRVRESRVKTGGGGEAKEIKGKTGEGMGAGY